MITIQGKTYSHSGYGWCDECKDIVCDGTNTGNQFKICINGHKYYYGKNKKQDLILFMI